jgi:histone H3/H4
LAKPLAKSNLAEAFRYATNRREALSRFATDALVEIDNNIAKNASQLAHADTRFYVGCDDVDVVYAELTQAGLKLNRLRRRPIDLYGLV